MVVESAGVSEGLEAGVCVFEYVSKGVVAEFLVDGAGAGVDDKANGAEVVGDDLPGLVAACHVVGNVRASGVDKAGGDGVGRIEFGDGVQAVFVVEPVGFVSARGIRGGR